MEKEIDGLRKLEVPDSCYKDTICKVQKSVVKLENRLDVVNKKCSNVLTDNSKLRDSINHMLQDRANFNEMWQNMVTKFNEGKKLIMDLIDQSTLAYDQREELCTKLQVLKERNENDKIMHIQEMREMQRRLEHDAKLQKFFDIKGQKRLNPELDQRESNKKLAQKEKLYSDRQKAELLEKETMQKAEALDYLNEQLEKAVQENMQTKEKIKILEQRVKKCY
ncbi:Coiled-coil domain-containing protein 63 [Eumeta japonica]|uniref:Coiled-coil domain-containing protein 63 n=1 Tax=Eumeta variegata TaxID=151549 RepID=A0A4C1TUG2_EUMVA|nr:Coiled-coil domain-containing protein 63 [Eumeta japonica]